MNGYLKISEISEKWGIKERRINTLCLEERIDGAIKFGNTWAMKCLIYMNKMGMIRW